MESQLFGHEKGAFTNAIERHVGCFEQADGGTLFLDEITEMSAEVQPKFLRVLEEGEVRRVGATSTIPVSVRVVAATNRFPSAAVKEGKLREDLFYRLGVFHLELPPLREREGDIPLLIRYFLQLHARRKAKRALRVESSAMGALERYSWPGNVREMENLMERLVVLSDDGVIRIGDLPGYIIHHNSVSQHDKSTEVSLPSEGLDLDGVLEKIENGFIEKALQRARGNKTMAAKLLKLNRTTFIERLRKKGMLQSANTAASRPETVDEVADSGSKILFDSAAFLALGMPTLRSTEEREEQTIVGL
jgi:DNA-binding NtrC family response regulator